MSKKDSPAENSLSYEQARDKLSDIVSKLENGNITLEESLKLWEDGDALAKQCETLLNKAKERIVAATEPEK